MQNASFIFLLFRLIWSSIFEAHCSHGALNGENQVNSETIEVLVIPKKESN